MSDAPVERNGQAAREIDSRVVASDPIRRTPRWVWVWAFPVVVLFFLYLARGILAPFVVAAVLAYIFTLAVDSIEARLLWPRWVIVTLMYVIVLGAIGLGIYFGAEFLYAQTRDFIGAGPNIIERGIAAIIGSTNFTFAGQKVDAASLARVISQALTQYLGASGDALHLARGLISTLLDTLLVIIVSFYLLLDGKRVGAYLIKFVPQGSRARTGYVAGRIHIVLGHYLRGQLLLIILMSAVSFVVLQFFFHTPFALPLGILTGFMEILPLVGPAVAAALAAIVTLSAHGAGAALGVVIVYLVLRELEDQVVMPLVVGRAVELHPVATIFAVLAGGAMAGVLGMLLAVPVAAAIKVVLDFLYPTNPDQALAEARHGMDTAQREEEAIEEAEAP